MKIKLNDILLQVAVIVLASVISSAVVAKLNNRSDDSGEA